METKANYVAVGVFTILLFVALMAFAYWVRTINSGPDAVRLDIVIEGSVTGLEIGSPVKFNGINVGKVDSLRFDRDDPRIVIAQTIVSGDTPIRPSTTATIGLTGLSGIAHIELEGGRADEPTIFQMAQERGVVPGMRADPSAINDILATVQDVARRVDGVLAEVDGFFSDARGPLLNTLNNTETVSQALADNADEIDTFLTNVGKVGDSLGRVADDLESLVQNVDGIVKAVPPEKVASIVDNVDRFTGELATISDDIGGVVSRVDATLAEFEGIGTALNASVKRVDDLLAAIPDDAIGNGLADFATASEAVREAAEDVAGVTSILDERRGDIEATLSNVAEMAQRLNAASVRVDGVLAKVDGFLGEGDASTLIDDASRTLASFRQVADTLNSRLDGITEGLERFSGRGLRDVEALVNETRRSISRIEGAISTLERNPQSLIFGTEGEVKRFDGRQRR